MAYEYKCIGAPERPKRQRGVRGRSERVALAMQELISSEAVDGWEYQRTDLVPVEEKSGWFSRAHEVHRAVLVFRRELDDIPHPAQALRRAQADRAVAAEAAPAPGESHIPLSAERHAPVPARGQARDGAAPRGPVREEPVAPGRGNRPPPTGLG